MTTGVVRIERFGVFFMEILVCCEVLHCLDGLGIILEATDGLVFNEACMKKAYKF
jgi:hypothetical protein